METNQFIAGDSPVISLALHDGHFLPENARPYMALSEFERLQEEDPYTKMMADLPGIPRIFVSTSRFFVDMNRPRGKATYRRPEDAWGLHVWKKHTPDHVFESAMAAYDQFYEHLQQIIEASIRDYGHFFLLDIHSYNHRRTDPYRASPQNTHPEINMGTYYNLPGWSGVLQAITGYLKHTQINGKKPDVQENVIFKGGGMAQWAIEHYGDKGAVASIEFKKTFMDEWTGRADFEHIRSINRALKGLVPLIEWELEKRKQK